MPLKSIMRPRSLPMGVSTSKQVLRGTSPKAANELRLDDRQLGVEILAAVGRLHRQRRAVVRRPAAEDVHDVNVLAAEFHALGDDVGKQLTRPADERFALPIFVRARGLADKDQLGMRIADAENRLRAIGDQHRAARASGHPLGHFGQGLLARTRRAGRSLRAGRAARAATLTRRATVACRHASRRSPFATVAGCHWSLLAALALGMCEIPASRRLSSFCFTARVMLACDSGVSCGIYPPIQAYPDPRSSL